jgi:hypothetical protein
MELFLLAVEGFLLAVLMVQYDWLHNLYRHICESVIGLIEGKDRKKLTSICKLIWWLGSGNLLKLLIHSREDKTQTEFSPQNFSPLTVNLTIIQYYDNNDISPRGLHTQFFYHYELRMLRKDQ